MAAKAGYVYVINGGKDLYKIGITKNDPRRRLKQLQTGSVQTLRLVKYYKSRHYKEIERQIHARLNRYRVRENGEWFNCSLETITSELEKGSDVLTKIGEFFAHLVIMVQWVFLVAIAVIVIDAVFFGGGILSNILNLIYNL